MKIAISTDLYYPMINGVAVFSRNLALGLSRRGHEVIVLAPSITGEFEIETDSDGNFQIARLPSVKFPFYPDQISKVPEAVKIFGKNIPHLAYRNGLHVSLNPYPEIKHVLDDFQPELIHDQTPGPVALAVFRYAEKRNIPIVSTGHAYPDNVTGQFKIPDIAKKPINAVVRRYFSNFLKKSRYATMPTEIAIHDLIPNKRKFKVPVEALSNGIDLSKFSATKPNAKIYEKYNIPKDRPIVIYVGRIDPEKSLHVLIEAFQKTLAKVPNAYLLVVGDGADKQRLMYLAENLKIDSSVKFTGRIIGEDLPQIYKVGDVFAITSTTETQSIVLMEAMASGLPPVAVRAGAISELIKNNQSGFLCRPDDSAAVSRGLVKILSNKDLRESMSKESLNIIKTHDIDHTLTRMEQIYAGVIAEHETPSYSED